MKTKPLIPRVPDPFEKKLVGEKSYYKEGQDDRKLLFDEFAEILDENLHTFF